MAAACLPLGGGERDAGAGDAFGLGQQQGAGQGQVAGRKRQLAGQQALGVLGDVAGKVGTLYAEAEIGQPIGAIGALQPGAQCRAVPVKEGQPVKRAVERAAIEHPGKAEPALGQPMIGQFAAWHLGVEIKGDIALSAFGGARGAERTGGTVGQKPEIGQRQVEAEIGGIA